MKCKICGKEESIKGLCFSCGFWTKLLEDDKKLPPHTACMIDGTHYIIGPEEDSDSCLRGFGGARFQIEFNDGHRVVTTNLWCQGKPEGYWKEKFPDNACFKNNLKWTKIGETEYLIEQKENVPF